MFEFESVIVEVNGHRILDALTLAIPSDGVTVVLGPSGAGKSTMLRLCNRLEVPTSGVVRFHADDIAGLDPLSLRRRVGMVFQRPTLFAGTLRDNLRVATPDADDATYVAALERAGLPATFLERVGDDLSGGEAQRACLARTLVAGPEVLLMDEPTSSLDRPNAHLLESRVVELARTGVPVVWVTHDLEQARRVGDHAVLLVGGKVADDHAAGHFDHGEPADHRHED